MEETETRWSRVGRPARTFWAWYEEYYTLNLGLTATLFVSQILHLIWLTTDVVLFRLFGVSSFPPTGIAQFLLAAVDYLEVPALVSATFFYLHAWRQRHDGRTLTLFLLVQSQWVHLLWITDEFIVSAVQGTASVSSTLPSALVWLAIGIDYLELPVIVHTTWRFLSALAGSPQLSPVPADAVHRRAVTSRKWTGGALRLRRAAVILSITVLALAAFLVYRARPIAPQEPARALSPATTMRVPLRVGGHTLMVEVARTPEAWMRGLMDRDALASDQGMLFVFPTAAVHRFWMKNTRIPLDLLWIREGTIVGITSPVLPEPGVPDEALRRYPSPEPVDQVLEVNAGWAAAHEVVIGRPVALTR